MSEQLILSISIDNSAEVQCMPLEQHKSGLGLSETGITWKEEADAVLFLDERKELMIQRVSDLKVMICRGGRRRELQLNHPIYILPEDCIYIGNHDAHSFAVNKIFRTHKPESWLSRLSKKAMFASAAALVMSCMMACNPSSVVEHKLEGDVMIEDPDDNEDNNNAENTDNNEVNPNTDNAENPENANPDSNTEVKPVETGNPVEEKHMGDCAADKENATADSPSEATADSPSEATADSPSDTIVEPVKKDNSVKERPMGKVRVDDKDKTTEVKKKKVEPRKAPTGAIALPGDK